MSWGVPVPAYGVRGLKALRFRGTGLTVPEGTRAATAGPDGVPGAGYFVGACDLARGVTFRGYLPESADDAPEWNRVLRKSRPLPRWAVLSYVFGLGLGGGSSG